MRLSVRLLAASALALSFAAPALAQDAATIQRAATIRDAAMSRTSPWTM
jgi:carboxypeptidase Q